jgi:AcrR family transcriptional regulator
MLQGFFVPQDWLDDIDRLSILIDAMSLPSQPKSPLRISPTSTPTISKAERTRAAILNSALDFVWSRPFREMTVTSVMAETEVGRSAFYQHFTDLHEVMATLLEMLQVEIFEATQPWYGGVGDPAALLQEALAGLVRVCYERGPILRAVTDAATSDGRFEADWNSFMGKFDAALAERIEADQAQGLIANFPARPVAIGLNRLDAYMLIHAFGQHPRSPENPVTEALVRIWVSTLYGSDQLSDSPPPLVRT